MKRVLFLCSSNYYRRRCAESSSIGSTNNEVYVGRLSQGDLHAEHPSWIISAFTLARLAELGIPIDAYQRMPIKVTHQETLKPADHIVAINTTLPTDRIRFSNTP